MFSVRGCDTAAAVWAGEVRGPRRCLVYICLYIMKYQQTEYILVLSAWCKDSNARMGELSDGYLLLLHIHIHIHEYFLWFNNLHKINIITYTGRIDN